MAIVVLTTGCFGGGKEYDDDDDSAGESGTGGKGGSKSSGGTGGADGGTGNGGSSNPGTGGDSATGGVSGSTSGNGGSSGGDGPSGGGTGATGGDGASGGTGGDSGPGGTASGGTGGDGASGGTGGDSGPGGTSGTGGTGGGGSGGDAGGPAVDCGSAFQTWSGGYVTSPGASGCWKGFAYTITDTLGTTISPSEFSTCTDGACSLCVSGTIAYDLAFGGYAGLGFNVNQEYVKDAPQASVVPLGTGLSIGFSNSASGTELRIQLQNATTQWCYTLSGSSGTVTIPYSDFRTECWVGGDSVYYAGEAITGIQLTVPGNDVYPVPYSFCLTSGADI